MNKEAKIHLSPLESELVNNTEWIFTKQIIIKKVQHILGDLHTYYQQIIQQEKDLLPHIFQTPGGKITKGENYQGLPYLILDYPAIFSKEDIFAVRTMFWWGNFFSISLHVSGKYLLQFQNIRELLESLAKKEFFICVNDKEWEHHFQPDNYCMVNDLSEEDIIGLGKNGFFKMSKKIELNQWDSIVVFLTQSFREIIEFIKISFPIDERVP
ncbi:MAG: hypothetical protein ABI325_06000 [Ginsengibacter sp.]